ncbi:MAG: hypothetical protein ACOX4D_04265 [Bacteroidales bacterium]
MKKKNSKKSYSTLISTMLILLFIPFISCKKTNNETVIANQNNLLDKAITEQLDSLFSPENDKLFDKLGGDTLFYVINSQEEWLELDICDEIDIDFNKYTLIFGRVPSTSSPSEITKKELVYDEETDLYTYNVEVFVNPDGYTAFSHLYFWDIFEKIENDITFNLTYN